MIAIYMLVRASTTRTLRASARIKFLVVTVDSHPISGNSFALTLTLSLTLGLFFLSGPLCPATGAIQGRLKIEDLARLSGFLGTVP
jgi:hypothetical protein